MHKQYGDTPATPVFDALLVIQTVQVSTEGGGRVAAPHFMPSPRRLQRGKPRLRFDEVILATASMEKYNRTNHVSAHRRYPSTISSIRRGNRRMNGTRHRTAAMAITSLLLAFAVIP